MSRFFPTPHRWPRFLAPLFLLVFCSVAHSIENSECLDCHSDTSIARNESEGINEEIVLDVGKFSYSVHNVNGIGCVDCHSDISELNYDNEVPHAVSLEAVNCSGCHEEEGKAYLNSVHRKAKGKGVNIPCYACHEYHYTQHLEGASVTERENAFCLKCHCAEKFHDWLPQKEMHFSFVECTVCHAPDAPRHIHLRFFDYSRNRFLEAKDIFEALGADYDTFQGMLDKDANGILDPKEFENLVLMLRQKNILGTFHGELVSELQPVIHHVNRGEAKRDCETCHLPTSPFFDSVTFPLLRPDNTMDHITVAREVLESYYVSHFYALGGTRVRLLDKIGIAMVVGGLGIVFAHLTARIVTIPLRRRKKEEQQG